MSASDFRIRFDRKEWEAIQAAQADVDRAEVALNEARYRLRDARKAVTRIELIEGAVP